MSRRVKTSALIEATITVLAEHSPMTLRQIHYQLVSRQVSENTRGAYQALSKALVAARREGAIAWELIEDRTRRPRHVQMFADLPEFVERVTPAYRRDVWADQPRRIEVWLEKDALSGIFEAALDPFGITLNVGRGFDGWDSIHSAAMRLDDDDVILYYGDFDPSGEDMVRSLIERLGDLGCRPEIIKCALTRDDIDRYNLPPDFTKATDTRRAAFVAKHGDISVEIDALPLAVLRDRIVSEVVSRIDLAALDGVRSVERIERDQIAAAVAGIGGAS
jgi:hypothetical protein